MSDSSDDEPLLARQKKLNSGPSGPLANGSGKAQAASVKPEPVSPVRYTSQRKTFVEQSFLGPCMTIADTAGQTKACS